MRNLVDPLEPTAVDMARLERTYGPLLKLVKRLIGVVPESDRYLEIWPPGFRTYNLIVPNFLNLPFSLWWASPPAKTVALAAYVASRAAECMYCAAHTFGFALRAGADPALVAVATGAAAASEGLDARARAVIAVAEGMSRIPARLDDDARSALLGHYSAAEAEWIVLGVAMMGFLNKCMDALGVPLEAEVKAEVSALLAPTRWSPGRHGAPGEQAVTPGTPPGAESLWSRMAVLRQLPAALRFERRWTRGVPARWPAAGELLRERTGCAFPILGRLRHGRAIRAVAVALRDNLAPEGSELGPASKHLAAAVFAVVAGNEELLGYARELATAAEGDAAGVEAVAERVARGRDLAEIPGLTASTLAALRLVERIATSPAHVDEAVLRQIAGQLSPVGIVELVVWLGLLQLLHRLTVFYPAR